MYAVNTTELQELIVDTYATKTPLMVYGGPGIGKSAIALQSAKNFAEKENKKFAEWTKASKAERF